MSPQTQPAACYRPRLVLAYSDSQYAALCCRQLRRLGWQVHLTRSGVEARRLARALTPAVVVLDTDLDEESGCLTCAKLLLENPSQRVVLVCAEITPDAERFAAHAGAAALVLRTSGAAALINEIHGAALSSAG